MEGEGTTGIPVQTVEHVSHEVGIEFALNILHFGCFDAGTKMSAHLRFRV